MLKLKFEPTEAHPKGKELVIESSDFAIEKHGVRYTDPDNGCTFVATYDKLASVELKMKVSDEQRRYAEAFRIANSDGNQTYGPGPMEQMRYKQAIKEARSKMNRSS